MMVHVKHVAWSCMEKQISVGQCVFQYSGVAITSYNLSWSLHVFTYEKKRIHLDSTEM